MNQSTKQVEHSTSMEIAFISQLGTHSDIGESRKLLLQKYLRSLDLRQHWGDLNEAKIRQAAERQLAAA